MNVKIAIRSGLAALLALSLSACDVEQYITFILHPITEDLVAIEMPASWDEPNTDNFEQFDAGEASQRVVLWNVDWDDMAVTDLTIDVFDANDVSLATGGPFDYVIDETKTELELEIDPNDHVAANTFVRGLPASEPSARRVDFIPSPLLVERLNPNIPVIACAELFYGDFSLDLKCEVLF